MTRVGLVVPAYRPDLETLAAYVEDLHAEFDVRIRIEIDDPGPGVMEALDELPATVSSVDGRGGKGAAITRGFEALVDEVDVLAFADADGSTPAGSVGRVVAAAREGADLAVGSRRHPDSEIRSHQTLARRRMGDAFAWTAGRLLDVQLYDYQCGAKALTADTWRAVRSHLYESGFAWDIELVAMTAALGRTVEEVPVAWVDRPNSTVAPLSTALELGTALLRSRHRAKRLEGSRLHAALADSEETALVDRTGPNPADD